jgi:SNF2 family DNA or RNA helicase
MHSILSVRKLDFYREARIRQRATELHLLMEMGTGKTLTTIAVEGALYLAGRIRRVLVVSPLSVTGVWKDEHDAYADFDYTLAVLKGSGEKKLDTLRHMTGQPLQIVVVNYESAWRLERELAAWKPDLIIADEGHKIKTHNITASKAMHRLAHWLNTGCS